MTDTETPQHSQGTPVTTFKTDQKTLIFYLLLGGFTVLQAGFTVFYFSGFAGQSPLLTFVVMAISLLIAVAGWWFISQALVRIRDPHDPITIGPDGLYDRALSQRPIRWEDIVDLRAISGGRNGPIIVFDLAEGGAARAGIWPRIERAARMNRMAGFTYRIHHYGTDATPQDLVWALAPYAKVKV